MQHDADEVLQELLVWVTERGFAGADPARGRFRDYLRAAVRNAAFRHLLAFLSGEDRDEESGYLHAAHFAWHGLALTSFVLRGVGTDDRADTVLANYREEREAA